MVKDLVSANSDSEEENHCFEIKKRISSSTPKEASAITKGRVNLVVAAFAAGLSINSMKQPISQEQKGHDNPTWDGQGRSKEDGVHLDEYGSNLLNPDIGTRKRPLEAVEGHMGDIPTLKKQFVEAADNLEQVEEASLEWPPSDK
ncbi:unnamed protein product [Linum trigynum]|uniref:Uncharacterized protein n=1 Tax=Linum trigynum TaxID=586398 RepID=A0AAV2FSN2_9ROSI